MSQYKMRKQYWIVPRNLVKCKVLVISKRCSCLISETSTENGIRMRKKDEVENGIYE